MSITEPKDIPKWLFQAFLSRADELTTWVGIIGATLILLGMTGIAFYGCIALIFLPDAKFSSVFRGWTTKLRSMS